jgi:hypothetical protein
MSRCSWKSPELNRDSLPVSLRHPRIGGITITPLKPSTSPATCDRRKRRLEDFAFEEVTRRASAEAMSRGRGTAGARDNPFLRPGARAYSPLPFACTPPLAPCRGRGGAEGQHPSRSTAEASRPTGTLRGSEAKGERRGVTPPLNGWPSRPRSSEACSRRGDSCHETYP